MITKNTELKLSNKAVIIYNHIPKCGGSSFHNMMQKTLGDRYYLDTCKDIYPALSHPINNDDWGKDFIAVGGHNAWGVHSLFRQEIPCFYVTFLRHPVARLLSQYKFDVNSGRFIGRIEEYLRIFPGNFMLRHLAGGNYDLAVHRLRNEYSFVGFVEKYDESLAALTRIFDIDLRHGSDIINKSPREKVPIPDDFMPYVEDKLAADLKLYQMAQELFSPHLIENKNRTKIRKVSYTSIISFGTLPNREKAMEVLCDENIENVDTTAIAQSFFRIGKYDEFKKIADQLQTDRSVFFFQQLGGLYLSRFPDRFLELADSFIDDILPEWILPSDSGINLFRLTVLMGKVVALKKINKLPIARKLCQDEFQKLNIDRNDHFIPWDFALSFCSMLRNCDLFELAAQLIEKAWHSSTAHTDDMLQELLVNSYVAGGWNLAEKIIDRNQAVLNLPVLTEADRRAFDDCNGRLINEVAESANKILVICPYASIVAHDIFYSLKFTKEKIELFCLAHQLTDEMKAFCRKAHLLPKGLFHYDTMKEMLSQEIFQQGYDAVIVTAWKHHRNFYREFLKIARRLDVEEVYWFPFNNIFFPIEKKYCFMLGATEGRKND